MAKRMTLRDEGFTIGELARRAGCSTDTVRFYERVRLMPRVPRTAGGYRLYGASHIRRLALIRRARELGFDLERIRAMLTLIEEDVAGCDDLYALTADHLADVRRKIAGLRKLEETLTAISQDCPCPEEAACPIMGKLITDGAC